MAQLVAAQPSSFLADGHTCVKGTVGFASAVSACTSSRRNSHCNWYCLPMLILRAGHLKTRSTCPCGKEFKLQEKNASTGRDTFLEGRSCTRGGLPHAQARALHQESSYQVGAENLHPQWRLGRPASALTVEREQNPSPHCMPPAVL